VSIATNTNVTCLSSYVTNFALYITILRHFYNAFIEKELNGLINLLFMTRFTGITCRCSQFWAVAKWNVSYKLE